MAVDSISIQYEPHYKAITEQGRNHFNRPADALAEFIDNSIQHSVGLDRSIAINVYLASGAHDSSYIIISDNGSGMTVDDIKAFATFALDRRSRKIIPTNPGDGNSISKFGVGAKQAGFYLGSNITILTKAHSSDHLLSFMMDEGTFEQRYQEHQSVYTDVIKRYRDLQQYGEEAVDRVNWSPIMWEHLLSQNSRNSFTSVVIELRNEVVASLTRNYLKLPAELTDIYYFHLHPEKQLSKGHSAPTNDIFHDLNQSNTPTINFHVHVGSKLELGQCLNEVTECRTSKFMQSYGDVFTFCMDIPDPNPTSHLPHLSNIHATSQVVSIDRKRVYGMITYYPYIDDHESHPDHMHPVIDLAEDEDNAHMINATPNFLIYWEKRLVPQSTWTELPFFQDILKARKDVKEKIAERWQYRIQGFLFFDWHFDHISNNKLKLLVDPDFNTWINSQEVSRLTLFTPKDSGKRMIEFLKRCSLSDKEFEFTQRILTQNKEAPFDKYSAYFSRVKYGRLELKIGDKVKWQDANKETKGVYFGEIVDFEVPRELSVGQPMFNGTGNFRYRILPDELRDEQVHSEKLTTLFRDGNMNYKCTEDDLNEYRMLLPHEIIVARVAVNNAYYDAACAAEDVYLTNPAEYNLFFQMKDGHGNAVLNLPHRPLSKKERYEVQLVLRDHEGDDADLGRQKELYDLEKDEVVHRLTEGMIDRMHYKFQNIKITLPGKQKLIVSVYAKVNGKDKLVLCVGQPIEVVSCIPEYVNLVEEFSHSFRLGEIIPSFPLQLFDRSYAPVFFDGPVLAKVQVDQDQLQWICPTSNGEVVEVACKEGVLMIPDSLIIPKEDEEVMINLRGSKVKLILEVAIAEDMVLSNKKSVYLTLLPGMPCSLLLADPQETPVTIKAGMNLQVKFTCVDRFNNPTCPVGGASWKLIQDDSIRDIEVKSNACDVQTLLSVSEIDEETRIETTFKLHTGVKEVDEAFQAYVLPIVLMPSLVPRNVQVLLDGEVIEDRIIAPAGSVLDKLTFQVLDSQQRVISDLSLLLEEKSRSFIECSWQLKKNKRRKEQIPSDFSLPSLKVPQAVDSVQDCELELYFSSTDSSLTCSFSVQAEPGAPRSMAFVHYLDTYPGIRANDASDLQNKMVGVVCVDQFSNPTSLPDYMPESIELVVAVANARDREEGSMQVLEFARSKQLLNTNYQGYALIPQAMLSSIFKAGDKIICSIGEFDTVLTLPDSLRTVILPGLPSDVFIRSETLNIPRALARQEMEVAYFTQLEYLEVLLVDRDGMAADISDLEDITLRVQFNGEDLSVTPVKLTAASSEVSVAHSFEHLFGDENMGVEEEIQFIVQYTSKGKLVTLPTAIVQCKPVKFNDVTGLRLEVQEKDRASDLTEESPGKYILSVQAGQLFPSLRIIAETDNEEPLNHLVKDFKFKLKAEGDKKKMQFSDAFSIDSSFALAGLMLTGNGSNHFQSLSNRAGEFEIKCCYTESRPEYTALPKNNRERQLKLKVSIQPSAPTKLSLCSGVDKANCIVTNLPHLALRLIYKRLKVEVQDDCGNEVGGEEEGELTCKVVPSDRNGNTSKLPILEGVNEDSVLVGMYKKGYYEFVNVTVAEESNCSSCEFLLRLSYSSPSCNLTKDIECTYSNAEQYSERRNKLERDLADLKEKKAQFLDLSDEIKSLKRDKRDLLNACPQFINDVSDDIEAMRALLGNRMSQIEQLQRRHSAPRAAVKKSTDPTLPPTNARAKGMLVNLAYVNDYNEARILSYHAGRYMNAWIVDTAETSQQLFARGLKAWAVELIRPFMMKTRTGQPRGRTKEEKDNCALPLPRITVDKDEPPGNPAYLVNLLRLDDEHEDLRDSVFYSIYSTSILFDTLEDAVSYRRHCVEKGQTCGILYSRRHGERLDANGLLDPNDKVPERLDYIFGEQPVEKSREYNREREQTEGERSLLEEIIAVAEQIDQKTSERDLVDIQHIDKEIKALETALRRIAYDLGGEIRSPSQSQSM